MLDPDGRWEFLFPSSKVPEKLINEKEKRLEVN